MVKIGFLGNPVSKQSAPKTANIAHLEEALRLSLVKFNSCPDGQVLTYTNPRPYYSARFKLQPFSTQPDSG